MSLDAKLYIKCPRRKDVQLAEEKSRLLKSNTFKISTRNIQKSTIKHIENPHCWQKSWEDTGELILFHIIRTGVPFGQGKYFRIPIAQTTIPLEKYNKSFSDF
jgi:hypothetical protein